LSSHPAAPLLAQDLGHLQHTNARGEVGLVQLPGFMSTAGMSEEQAGEAGLLALAIAEGVIETLEERHGYRVVHKSEIRAQAEKIAAERYSGTEVKLHCNRCQKPIVGVDTSSAAPKVHTKTMAAALAAHAEVCG
jgi:hypothetical protein